MYDPRASRSRAEPAPAGLQASPRSPPRPGRSGPAGASGACPGRALAQPARAEPVPGGADATRVNAEVGGIRRRARGGAPTASTGHRRCSATRANDNAGPAMLFAQHQRVNDAVRGQGATASTGHGCCSLGGRRQRWVGDGAEQQRRAIVAVPRGGPTTSVGATLAVGGRPRAICPVAARPGRTCGPPTCSVGTGVEGAADGGLVGCFGWGWWDVSELILTGARAGWVL
jgi:hypothetical protein